MSRVIRAEILSCAIYSFLLRLDQISTSKHQIVSNSINKSKVKGTFKKNLQFHNPLPKIIKLLGFLVVDSGSPLSELRNMDKFSKTYFDWKRIEKRYGSSQGEIDPKLYNFHLQIVEIYFKYFHGKRIGADLPYRMRQRFMRELFISFIKRCFLITFQRYYDYEKCESDLLLKFKIYRQFLPILLHFDSYFH